MKKKQICFLENRGRERERETIIILDEINYSSTTLLKKRDYLNYSFFWRRITFENPS